MSYDSNLWLEYFSRHQKQGVAKEIVFNESSAGFGRRAISKNSLSVVTHRWLIIE